MPYTPAHPITAIVLDKLLPNKFNKTGLVLGSIAPDLRNFMMLRPVDTGFEHSHAGMLTVGLPASIVLAFAFHRLVLPAAAIHLPAPFNRIAYRYVERGWRITGVRGWAVLLLSIMLGLYSHVFLDGFSHRGGLMYPIATGTVEWMLPRAESPAAVVQLGISLLAIGIELLLLTVFLLRRWGIASAVPHVRGSVKGMYWFIVLIAMILITAIAIVVAPFGHARHLYFIIPVASLTGAVIGLLAASVAHFLNDRSWKRLNGEMNKR
ncbi:DUF4184 family protein [Paenibacillus mesophilus]|uniref:DUF4184 family protein n=1 Tax=Paenibacillus mesophilus TaxID=2582849 RepID=UPI0013052631|nr:DUF4184 family protein [Paenibacillus mesophilus]